jgi:dTDP-4-dehydrorhamnose reductase
MNTTSGPAPRVLVIGRAGQLATDLVDLCRSENRAHAALGRPDVDLATGVGLEAALDAHRPDFVVNAAAYTNVDKAESEADLAMAVNATGPGLLARACRAAGVPLIHVSTDMVFGDERDRAHREEDATGPVSTYARSKLEGEWRVAEAGGPHLIVRVSWVFGPSGDNFVKKVLQWARANPTLRIVSDQRGRPTYSPALADALLGLGDSMLAPSPGARPSGVLHVAGESVMTRDEQARLVLAGSAARGGPTAAVVPVPTAEFPTPARRALNAVMDIEKAAALGIRLGPFAPDLDATLDRVLGPAGGAEGRG